MSGFLMTFLHISALNNGSNAISGIDVTRNMDLILMGIWRYRYLLPPGAEHLGGQWARYHRNDLVWRSQHSTAQHQESCGGKLTPADTDSETV
jgi:hypothetical protein